MVFDRDRRRWKFWRRPAQERLARSVALEDISAVTKISQRHLIALEQEKFRLLPAAS